MKKIFTLVLLWLMVMLAGCVSPNPDTYLLTFVENNENVPYQVSVSADTIYIPESIPQKEGYVFEGWYIDEALYYPMAFHVAIASNITLYAKWEPIENDTVLNEVLSVLEEHLGYPVSSDALVETIHSLINETEEVDIDAIVLQVLDSIDVVAMFEMHMADMIAQAQQSVVMVDCYYRGELESGGSGVIYKKVANTYYVVTNQHVVDEYNTGDFEITVFLDNEDVVIPRTQVTLLGESVVHDLAVLRFTSSRLLPVMEMGSVNTLRAGQMVFAIGSPLDLPNTVTMGVISYVNRYMYDDYGMDTYTVQHSAPISPGNSGGALVDIYGRLIGLNVMSYVDEYVGEGIEGIHFAIQINIILQQTDILDN